MKKTYALIALIALTNPAQAATPTEQLQQVIAGEHRSQPNKARDIYRHPEQTLSFFDVRPDMSVVEIWPGGQGWYTEILAPYLKDKGTLYAAHFAEDSSVPYFKKGRAAFLLKLKQQPEQYSQVKITTLQPPQSMKIAPDNSVDRVLTFRNVHNWMKSGHAASVFKAMYAALKPGGILGVVEHRSAKMGEQDPQGTSGYVSEDYVISLARNAGFNFLEKSEINANPKDDQKHPQGVWNLPPTLKAGDQDKEKYLSIGESNRMTIKFIKPNSLYSKKI